MSPIVLHAIPSNFPSSLISTTNSFCLPTHVTKLQHMPKKNSPKLLLAIVQGTASLPLQEVCKNQSLTCSTAVFVPNLITTVTTGHFCEAHQEKYLRLSDSCFSA